MPLQRCVHFATLHLRYTTFHFITTHIISATSWHRTARASQPFHFVSPTLGFITQLGSCISNPQLFCTLKENSKNSPPINAIAQAVSFHSTNSYSIPLLSCPCFFPYFLKTGCFIFSYHIFPPFQKKEQNTTAAASALRFI
jgi:hypothetical protein